MKASEILNVALSQILQHAVFEFTQIVNNLISRGEIDSDTDTYDAYLTDFGIKTEHHFGVWVTDTYTTEFSREERTLIGFRFDREEKAVYVLDEESDYDEEDPIALRALPTDDVVELTDILEEMWGNLIKTK